MDAVQKYMINLRENFPVENDFWDCVVISAADVQQKECFQQQIDEKLKNQDICGKTSYFVIEDCPGVALGSGGSTFLILKFLINAFGEKLLKMKVLICHAGGNSKRLPNLSCTGKLFCYLPLEADGKATTILNLKMLITSPFLALMKHGGLFICASDDIETFYLNDIENLTKQISNLDEDCIIALGHPSSITIGETHGVYVLPSSGKVTKKCWLSPCLEVLQKPSYKEMEAKGALFKTDDGEEKVYTDSMFWCRPKLVSKMVRFALECEDLYSTETCIYGDFLACMGTCPIEEKRYMNNLTNLNPIKRKIAEFFGETPLNVLVLESSHFYHLGTMPEYLENLHPSSDLFCTLGMKRMVQSACCSSADLQGVVTASLLQAEIKQMPNSIIDSCIINVPLVCEESTILSNCYIEDPVVQLIPAGWMFHTAAVKIDNLIFYITIAFRVDDDLKGSVGQSIGWKSTILESPSSSLWQAHLFEAHTTMSESFTSTWTSIVGPKVKMSEEPSQQHFSMEDIVKLKFIPAIMEHRRSIFCKITSI